MKASVVITRVSKILGDTGTTTIYNELKDLVPAIAAAQRVLLVDRPDARMGASNAWPAVTDPTASTSDMIVGEAWTEAVANEAAFLVLNSRARTKLDTAGAEKFHAVYLMMIGA